jgi:hypothetical protein
LPSAILSFQQANHLNPSLYVPNFSLASILVRTGKAPGGDSISDESGKDQQDRSADAACAWACLLRSWQVHLRLRNLRAHFARSQARRRLVCPGDCAPEPGGRWTLARCQWKRKILHLPGRSMPSRWRSRQDSTRPQLSIGACLIPILNLRVCIRIGLCAPPASRSGGRCGRICRRARGASGMRPGASWPGAHAIDSGDNEQAVKLLQELWGRDHGFLQSNAAILMEGLSNDAAAKPVTAYFSQQNTVDPGRSARRSFVGLQRQRRRFGTINAITANRARRARPAAAGSTAVRTAEEYYAAGEFEQCAQRLDPVPC